MSLIETVIIDLDGVVWRLNELIPGAKEAINSLRERGTRTIFLTNNSGMSRQQVQEKLARMGITASFEEILSSANLTARYISSRHPNAKVLMVGSLGLESELNDAKLMITKEPLEANYVVAGFDNTLTYDKLNIALQALLNGAVFVATNDDGMLPIETGFQPGAGAVVGAISGMIKRVPDVVVGKPNTQIIKQALTELGVSSRHALIVGDSLNTDVLLAHNMSMQSILVLSGNTRSTGEIGRNSYAPDYIVDSLADLPKLFEQKGL